MPSQQELRALFDYADGSFVKVKNGQRVGYRNGAYMKVSTPTNKCVPLHRAIWVWHNGPIPDDMWIDHMDRDRFNNRIENLRLATPQMNGRNRRVGVKHKWHGAKGLHWQSHQQMFRAQVKENGNVVYLGSSKDPHRLIWLLHLYHVGLYIPKSRKQLS